MGSNPASPTITEIFDKNYHLDNINFFLFKNKKNKNTPHHVSYAVNFISLISPLSVKKIPLIQKNVIDKNNVNKKIFFKKSYIVLTWFYYLSFINLKKKNQINIKIFIKPKTKRIFTAIKAPIAHKTNSKEQYKFSFYSFIIKFSTINFKKTENLISDDANHTLKKNSMYSNFLFIWITKKNLFSIETNLFFLKSYYFFSTYSDKIYFSLK